MNNTPYLRVRAAQVLKGWSAIPRGISLTFALFAEIAGRDKATIDRAWTSIFYSQLWLYHCTTLVVVPDIVTAVASGMPSPYGQLVDVFCARSDASCPGTSRR